MNYSDDPQIAALKLPPHSIEAEQSLIGGLLLDNDAWDRIADVVAEADFYRDDHRRIFGHIRKLVEMGKPADIVTVFESIDKANQTDQTGGLAYLGEIANATPSAANVRRYAEIVHERAVLRKLVTVGDEIAASALNPAGRDTKQLLDEAEQRVFEIAEAGAKSVQGFEAITPLLGEVVDNIQKLYERDNPSDITGIPSGFHDLDKMTSGLHGGDMIVVAGRPAMGKTAFALNIAEHVGVELRLPVAIFSMEMSGPQVAMRMLSSTGRLDQHKTRTGKLSDDDWDKMTVALGKLHDAPVEIDETGGLNVSDLRARARRLARKYGGKLGLIVIDYLQLMSSVKNNENRATEISEISRSVKALAKELDVPILALSQLSRKVEERNDKRPLMSDLRECVTGDTLVMLADGCRRPIRDLVGQTPQVISVKPDGQLETAATDLIWSVGKKETVLISLASGRTLRCSKEHRLRVLWDWKHASELQPDDRIAIARCLPEPSQTHSWPEHEIILLAHLIGDGSYVKHQPLRYTTASEENNLAVTEAAMTFGSIVKRHVGRGNWHQLVISGNGNRWHPQGVGKWLKDLGIFGQRSHDKHLPAGVFQLPNAQLALFLRHLWATDGCIHVGKNKSRIYFVSASEALVRDVAALLLRFGIVARIKHVTTVANEGGWFTADVSGAEQKRIFLRDIGAFGPRAESARQLMAILESTADNTNVDTLPEAVFDYVREQMQLKGITSRRMAGLRGTAYGGNAHFNFAPSRETLLSYAEILDDDRLRTLSRDGLFWDRVVAIEPAGEEEVFDLTVPGHACWLADGIVSHNSGAIEQDADIILMMYREEYYKADTAEKGVAEIIIGKQRNGPTGTVKMTFLGEYTKFENFAAPGSY